MILPGFIGPSYVSRSPNVAHQTLRNWYPQSVEAGESKARITYEPRPGLTSFAALPTAPVRGLFAQNGRAFAVGGLTVYEVFANGTPNALGTLAFTDANPATMCSNGSQVFITSGGGGNILTLNSNVVTAISAPGYPTNTATGTFLDTYFLTAEGHSLQFNISASGDGTSWDALDFGLRVAASDDIVAISQYNRLAWVLGSQTAEPWYDSGNANFPFQLVPQVLVPVGCAAAFSVIRTDSALCWLGQSERGQGRFYAAASYQPQRISTYPLEAIWATYPTISDCVAFAMTWQGHEFAVLNFASGNATWAFDFNENAWSQWTWWNALHANHDRWRGWTHCEAFGMHLIGDWETGQIYVADSASATDNNLPIIWERASPHLCQEQLFNYYGNFMLDMETGLGGTTPTANLDWSDDGGHTFCTPVQMTTGILGEYRTRCRAAGNLGRSRDRIFRVRLTNSVPPRALAAYVDVEQGTS